MFSSPIGEDTSSSYSDRRYSVSSFISDPNENQEASQSNIPPPEGFANGDPESTIEENKVLKRNDRPPIPAKPKKFIGSRNMNNNNRVPTQVITPYGSTKLKNLMLLRQPAKKPERRHYSSDDSCDSFSDTDDSCDEHDDTLKGDDSKSIDANSTISSISSTSLGSVKEDSSGLFVIVKILIPEQKLTKCMQLKITETVWTAKLRIIQSLAKKFTDPLNYGLYHEKLRTFLHDHKTMSEYIESGSVGALQMRYKCRRMEDPPRSSKEAKQITKMQSSSKRRDFLNHVQQYSTDKIYSLIRKGMDPNFACPNTGETPLTMLSSGQSRGECVSVFMALLGGGAHLDFRNQRGFTPMHVAARSGNIQMLKTLLEFHASPNVVDSRDLTPLYHCVLLGSDPAAASILITNGCTIGCCDSQGWNEIHQACRHGRIQLLELLLSYETVDVSMVNSRNASGNTPLHVCALYNQEMCAVTLLMHGADTTIRNFANQDAVQVAHVAANISVAQLISDYPAHRDEEHPLMRMRAESISVVSDHHLDIPKPERSGKKNNIRATWTPSSMVKHCQQYMFHKPAIGTVGRNKETYTMHDVESRFDSSLPPNAKIPDVKYPKSSQQSTANGITDENKVRIVVRNYDARSSDELSLRVGTRVVVLNSRTTPAGYHDGVVNNQRGFFPQDCVEQVKLRRPHPETGQRAASENVNEKRNGEKSPNSRKQYASADAYMNHTTMPDSISIVSFESGEDGPSGSPVGRRPSVKNNDLASLQSTSVPGIHHNRRNVTLWKGEDGFGFILRGAKADGPVHDFDPTAKYPALQYLESIEVGSNAHNAGLRCGDFILKIGETDVRRYGHQQLVETIRACGEPLHIQVTTVVQRKPSADSVSLHSNSSSKQAAKGHGKSDSISSALDHLDNILALEDSDGSDQTATLRRLPGSRKLRTEDIQDLFARQNGSPSLQRSSSQQSTFSSAKRPIRALPPSLTSGTAYDHHDPFSAGPMDDTTSVRSMSSSSSNSSTFTTWGRSTGAANPSPPHSAPFKFNTVSAATGVGIYAHNGSQGKKVAPPPPRRINSRLSVTIPEETVPVKSPSISTQAHSSSKGTQHTMSPQNDMAMAIAMAAKSRAERASTSEEQTKTIKPVQEESPIKKSQENAVESTSTKSVAELSSALSIALAAKQRIINQRTSGKTPPTEVKKPQATSFTVDPSRSTITKTNQWPFSKPAAPAQDRHVLPPPPSQLPPPPPPNDMNDISGLSLPPPPTFPAPEPHSEHHTMYNHLTFDELMNLPPPPPDLLPSPNTHDTHTRNIKPPEEYRRQDGKLKPTSLGLLPPPPIPPPMDDDDGCISPTGADSLSNADSGVADVNGDGLNNSSHHRSTLSDHHLHDHIGDNHSTVSSVSTISTLSSEDGTSDFPPSTERSWPLREVRTSSSEDSKSKESPPASPAGNMYLDILKKAKNKNPPSNLATPAASNDAKKNLRPGITMTKMTFAPITSLPPPAEESSDSRPKSNSATFPPAPKENTNSNKIVFGKPSSIIETKKIAFGPKAVSTGVPLAKPAEKTVIKTTPLIMNTAKDTGVVKASNPVKSVNSVQKNTTSVPSDKPLKKWSVNDVADWLRELQLEMYIPMFEENEISGEHLPDLGKDELIELGVKRVGHRLTIDRAVKKLTSADA